MPAFYFYGIEALGEGGEVDTAAMGRGREHGTAAEVVEGDVSSGFQAVDVECLAGKAAGEGCGLVAGQRG